jgi:hypothetical protein
VPTPPRPSPDRAKRRLCLAFPPLHDAGGHSHPGLIIRLIIQTIRRDRSGSDQIDEASNVSRPDPSGAEQIDAEHQATDLAVDSSRFLHASLSS